MWRLIYLGVLIMIFHVNGSSQSKQKPFGKGFIFEAKDSSFSTRLGFRFQNLINVDWSIQDGSLTDPQVNALIRRSRIKLDGYAHSPKLKYKLELGLSNRDIGGGNSDIYNNATRFILDAYIDWNFSKHLYIKFGQAKLPGNRERVISSGNLQFVDRSRLNSRFNIDRDFGLQLKHQHKIGSKMIAKEIFSISQGEGRNITAGNIGGLDYTGRIELLPFGSFESKGDYVGSAIKREESPKLSIGLTYDVNINAPKARGQNGSFITDEDGNFAGKTLTAFFADFMYKYRNISIMGEYVHKNGSGDSPLAIGENDEILGTYYTGTGFNIQAGYMFDSNWEVAMRYTVIDPDELVSNNETEYTLGLSKFIVGHKLKVQTDLGYRQVDNSNNKLVYRMQMDIHF